MSLTKHVIYCYFTSVICRIKIQKLKHKTQMSLTKFNLIYLSKFLTRFFG